MQGNNKTILIVSIRCSRVSTTPAKFLDQVLDAVRKSITNNQPNESAIKTRIGRTRRSQQNARFQRNCNRVHIIIEGCLLQIIADEKLNVMELLFLKKGPMNR
jgi:hypothetical protein